jgi:hypothetical protein
MNDRDYLLRRAAEEVAAAERAVSDEVRRIHRELANRYLMIVDDGQAQDRLSA